MSAAPRRHHNVTLAVLVTAGICFALTQSLVIPALPQLEIALGTTREGITWVFTGYLLAASVGTPIIGRLGDMFGKKRLFVIVMGILCAGMAVSAVATSLSVMLLGRVMQGLGAGIFPLGYGIVRDEFPPARVSHGIGLLSSLLALGGALGVVLAGPIAQHLGYHWLFWLPLITSVPVAVAAQRLVPESPVKSPGRVNWGSAALMSAGLVVVLLTITRASTWGWASARTLGGLAVGALILAVWIVRELRAPAPLVDMAMMRVRGVWTTNIAAFLVGVGMYSAFILIPQFVQEPKSTGYGLGVSVLMAGVFVIPMTVTQIVLGQFVGRIERAVGSKWPLLAGAALTCSGFLVLLAGRTHAWQVLLASGLIGLGVGFAYSALANLIVEHVSQAQTGVATGMNSVMRTVGGALGAQIGASLLSSDVDALGHPTAAAYGHAFGACAGALVISVAVGTLIPVRAGSRPDPALVSSTSSRRVARAKA
jgi:EmrB/QacA subfamily drug resistance transporter